MIMRRPLKRHRVAWYLDDAVNRMAWYLDMRRHSKLPAPAPNAADPAGNYWSYYLVLLQGEDARWHAAEARPKTTKAIGTIP